MRTHPQIAALAIVTACATNAVAQEGVLLPVLDRYELGRRSMIAAAGKKLFDGVVSGGLEVGPRWSGDWRGPYTNARIDAELGFAGAPFNYVDLSSNMNARWSLAPLRGTGPGEFDLAGHHQISMMLGGMVDADGFYLDLAPRQRLHHSTSGAWGIRPIDVAPEPFYDYTWAMSLWLNHGSHGGPERPGLKAIELSYEVRATMYRAIEAAGEPLPRTRTIHHVYIGAGHREHNDNAFRLNLSFLRPHYVTTVSTLTPDRWHRFDFEVAKLAMHGAEVDELSGYMEASLGISSAFQEAGVEPLHTGIVDLALRFDAPGLLDFGIAGGHKPGFDPAGQRALGITQFEVHLNIDPEPHHYGGTVRGRIDRLVELEDDIDDQLRGQITGELYTRIFGMQLGGAGRGAYGAPTGSMGWNPFAGPVGWSAYVGGFLRGEACFSARCEKTAAPVSSMRSPAEMLE